MENKKSNSWTLNRILGWVGLVLSFVAAWIMEPVPVLSIVLCVIGAVCGFFGFNSSSRAVGIGAILLGIVIGGITIWGMSSVSAAPTGW